MPISKLPPYKQQLLDQLIADGWELVVIDKPSSDEDSDIIEQWTIRSERGRPTCEIFVSFVDMLYTWWGVVATPDRSISYRGIMRDIWGERAGEPGQEIAVMNLTKGHYNDKMLAFVNALNAHRDAIPADRTTN